MDIDISECNHVPYHCGRLLAHLDLIRRTMDGDSAIGTTCFQTAAAMPAPVLGSLLALSWRDLSAIHRNSGRTRHDADMLEQRLATILDDLGGLFPETLDRNEQGAFAVGFYQERAIARSISVAARRWRSDTTPEAVLREFTLDAATAVPDDL